METLASNASDLVALPFPPACRALRKHTDIKLLDRDSHLMMVATPKAGSSTACQIMFAHTGQLELARSFVPPRGNTGFWGFDDSTDWEHNYMSYVWAAQPQHSFPIPRKTSELRNCNKKLFLETPRTAIVKLVRWPISRVVSSYMYALSDAGITIANNWWAWQRMLNNATIATAHGMRSCVSECRQSIPRSKSALLQRCSTHCLTFESMVTALEQGAYQEANRAFRPFICHDHIFPQTSDCDRNASMRNVTYYLPLETITHGLRALQTVLNFTALPSMTSKEKMKINGTLYMQQVDDRRIRQQLGRRDLARMPHKEIVALYGKGRSPPYRHFLADPALRERVRCLFRMDLALYVHLCAQPLLRVRDCNGKCIPSHCRDPLLEGAGF